MAIKTMQKTLNQSVLFNNDNHLNSLCFINADGSVETLCSVPSEVMHGFSALLLDERENLGPVKIFPQAPVSVQALALTPVDSVHYKTSCGRIFGDVIDRELVSLTSIPKAEKEMIYSRSRDKTSKIKLTLNDCNGECVSHFALNVESLISLISMIKSNSLTFGERAISFLQLNRLECGGYHSAFGVLNPEVLGKMLQNIFIAKWLFPAKIICWE